LERNDGGSEKKVLPPFVSMNALLFSSQYGHASFSMCAPTKNHSISWEIIDSPHQSRPHNKIRFLQYIISQNSEGP